MHAVGGSFFESVPAGGDAYVLKHIIHDWDDEKSIRDPAQRSRRDATADAKLLIVESVVPDDDREHLSKLLDLEMLVAATGKERTEAEYAHLLTPCGLPPHTHRPYCRGRRGLEAVAV